MEALINYLLQFGHLNQQQIDLVKSKGVLRELKKEEFYAKAGQIPREIIFLTEGIFRICYYNHQGDEITKYFIDENNFIADITAIIRVSLLQNMHKPSRIANSSFFPGRR